MLPDHPRLSDRSHGNLFDNTEIEEALLLHVHTLTDEERTPRPGQDQAVGDMLERALALGPEEIMALHSGLTAVAATAGPEVEVRGEQPITVDGVTYARGDTLRVAPRDRP